MAGQRSGRSVGAGSVGGLIGDAVDQAVALWTRQQRGWDPGRTLLATGLGAAQGLATAAGQWSRYKAACFGSGTPLLTPEGSKPIEQFKVGDILLSRDEHDPAGPVLPRQVEEVFVRTGRILHLHIEKQVIRTTAEHPFYVQERGWQAAAALQAGDLLLSHDGRWIAVEEVLDTEEYETVYNLRIADFHTYFVGCGEWGFSVWAHNTCEVLQERISQERANTVMLGELNFSLSRSLAERLGLTPKRHGFLPSDLVEGGIAPEVRPIIEVARAENVRFLNERGFATPLDVNALGRVRQS